MADTTLAAIYGRFEAVLQAAPLSLKPAADAFSHDRQPNTMIDGSFYLDDAGLGSQKPLTNLKAARIDRIAVNIASKLKFAGAAARTAMHTTLLSVERYLKADGPIHDYHVEIAGRRVTRPKGSDYMIGSLTVAVDYDVNESTS